jgi:dipeptidyl aminopeptidase/acylaminoacyl peptidase
MQSLLAQTVPVPPIHEEVTFKSIDGMKIYGNLYRPKGNGPFPAIVRVHGGLHGQAQSRRQDYFVDNGYVVLDVDYRGSEGHGKDYRNKLAMADKELDDVIAGAKFLQTLASIQKDKIAIMGDDRGAYITYSVIARPNPFKAAVAINGYVQAVRVRIRDCAKLHGDPETDERLTVHDGREVQGSLASQLCQQDRRSRTGTARQ